MNPAEEKKIRAFIALKPPEEWIAAFDDLQKALAKRLPSRAFRWVAPAQIHVTLRFFGGILPEDARQVTSILRGICAGFPPFTLSASGLGCFPSPARPRVLWAGLGGDLSSIEKLHSAIREATLAIGEKPEDRKFSAHLTLARVKEPSRVEVHELKRCVDEPFTIEQPWSVREVLLMQSHLSPAGSRYEVISTHALG